MVESSKLEANRKKHLKNTGVFVLLAFDTTKPFHIICSESPTLYYLDFLKSTIITE